MSGHEVEVAPPSARRLLARAAGRALADAVRRTSSPSVAATDATLPSAALAQPGVAVAADTVGPYARVVGARLGGAVPPLLPHVLAFPLQLRLLTDDAMPFPLVGLVHLAQQVAVHERVAVGDRIDLRVAAQDLRPHRSGRQFDVVVTAAREDRPVWVGTSTYLHRDEAGDDAAPPPPGPVDGPGPAGDDLRWAVPADVGRRYARVSGDANPIHLSAASARALGFPRAIAHGMWTLARLLATLEGRVADELEVLARFEKPVLLPARVRLARRHGDDGVWRLALHGDGATPRRHCVAEVAPLDR